MIRGGPIWDKSMPRRVKDSTWNVFSGLKVRPSIKYGQILNTIKHPQTICKQSPLDVQCCKCGFLVVKSLIVNIFMVFNYDEFGHVQCTSHLVWCDSRFMILKMQVPSIVRPSKSYADPETQRLQYQFPKY